MITASGLARTFRARGRTVEAVRGVDLAVQPGELVGFLGPNGAGKTTTLRMLTTLLVPTAGQATVAGCDLRKDSVGVRKRIGYVAQGGGTTPELKVIEELVLQARFYGLTPADAQRRSTELMERMDIADLGDRIIKTLSGGQRRRLDVALGLVHDPRLVFLDEPSTGLDPQSRANLWDHIRSLRDHHDTTVFLTTHYLDEADALCDRILVIDNGRIIAEGSPDELKAQVSGDEVRIGVPAEDVSRAAEVAEKLPGAGEITTADTLVRFRVPRGDVALPELLRALDGASITLNSIQVHRPTLDDVFLTMTGRSLRDAEQEAVAEEPGKEPANVA
ncbi:ATP-binding cassette domain-containing protein [Actinophytocola sp.]|uniref:ATP-binding cassette domain-containing protein n=1 Tax=Actinophytocola sp. TaxID=1872138 RepID=UPI002D81119C|nr:ATP-binding cassette domain-containing protein [Actinophytocola sp.]HET9140462.1 ATP-binding cassette domain-containing protein [Actinophytocola sp.]